MSHTYRDIDLSFKKHPGTGDVLKKFDVDAVKAAIKHIFLTTGYEKPFSPDFGMGINHLLFENMTPASKMILMRKVREQVFSYEPRAAIDDVRVILQPDRNTVYVALEFHVIGDPEPHSINISVERVR